MDTVPDAEPAKEKETQSLQEASATASPGEELLTVKDLQTDKKQEKETKANVPTVKETKENVQKGTKAKKGGNAKRATNKGKKKKSVVRARNEPPKTPPFRAGLVPETKPPKGLAQKAGGVRKKGNSKEASPELQEKTELDTKETAEDSSAVPPGIPVRVDSETGEVEQRVSPARSEKMSSRTASKTPPDEKISVSREDDVSVRSKTVSSRAESKTSRAESKSSRAESDSPHEKTPSPHEKTSSPHDATPSPREQRACPRDREAVFPESVNTNVDEKVVTETVEAASEREPSPEVVLTEKERRANARAAQRAAAAERRRQEVERKRREREEARRRAQDEEARLDVLRKESEEEMKKREEERR